MAEHSSGELPMPGGIESKRAALLNAVLSTVNADDLAEIEATLNEKAKSGDKQAARLGMKVGRLKVALREFDQSS